MTKQEAELVITKELDSGERLLWADVPRQGFLLRGSDAAMIPFSLLWCGFTVYWESLVVKSNGPLVLKLWGASDAVRARRWRRNDHVRAGHGAAAGVHQLRPAERREARAVLRADRRRPVRLPATARRAVGRSALRLTGSATR